MPNRIDPASDERLGVAGIALQLLGLAGASHLLEQLARGAPGFARSRLAEGAGAFAPQWREGTLFDPSDPIVQTLVVAALAGALLEELVFRGLLFAPLRRFLGPAAAIGVSALLFGAAHGDVHHAVVASFLGLQLGLIRELYGLGLAVAAHLTNNALWLAAVFLSPILPLEPLLPSPASLLLAALACGSAWAALRQAWRRRGAASAPRLTASRDVAGELGEPAKRR